MNVNDLTPEGREVAANRVARGEPIELEGLLDGAQTYVLPGDLEEHRHLWARVAAQNGWYREPFFVQVWVDAAGHVTDSVSTIALDRDIVLLDVPEDEDEDELGDLNDRDLAELLEIRRDWALDAGQLERVNEAIREAEAELTAEDALLGLQSYAEAGEPEDYDRLAAYLGVLRRLVDSAGDVIDSEVELQHGSAIGAWPEIVGELARVLGRAGELDDPDEEE